MEVMAQRAKPDGGPDGLSSILNFGETLYILATRQSFPVAEEFLKRLPKADGMLAAVVYGDSFAIALARAHGARIITGDLEIQRQDS